LTVSHAFHSSLMEPVLAPFEQNARKVHFHEPRLPLVSNLSGGIFGPGKIPDATYWRRHMREGVQFAAGVEELYRQGYELFLDVGPSPTLSGMGQRCLPQESNATWLATLRQGRGNLQQMVESLAALYVRGVEVEWTATEPKDAQ